MANINRPGAVRRLQTEPWKPVHMTEAQAQETWGKLKAAICKIHDQNASQLSFEELYRSAYNMVLHRHGPMLYSGMEGCLESHLRNIAAELEGRSDLSLVKDLLQKWHRYHKSTQMIRDILMYMDRTFVKHLSKTPVYDRGMQIWTKEIVRHPSIGKQLRAVVLEQVARERDGEAIERGTLAEVTSMMMELGRDVYAADLEAPFLDASRHMFKGEVQRCISEMDCPQYYAAVDARIDAEEERVAAYLHESTHSKLLALVDKEFIDGQLETVLHMENSGFVHLLESDEHVPLQRIFRLCTRIGARGHTFLRQLFYDHVKDVGKALVSDSEATKDASVFVQKLLDLRAKYLKTIEVAFVNDRQFLQSLNQAFEVFVNEFARSAEYISLFLDMNLRKGMGSMTDAEADDCLDRVLHLFRYLQDKDLFERYYKQHLAKRLLSGRGLSDDTERLVLSKLKVECGYQFTQKLESMFVDIKTSQDTMAAFRQYMRDGNIQLVTDISVQVLTTGSWPSSSPSQCVLPMPLEQPSRVFKDYYEEKHSGRNLSWHTAMGTADLKVTLNGKPKEISVTTYQMCILMLLNDQPEVTYAELVEATKIPREELKRSLIGMCLVKGKNILKKDPKGKDIADSDVFSFNEKFDSKQFKIKFAAAGAQSEPDPERGTRGRVEEDRKHHIDAAIVRIMKTRRVLDYNSIISEVTRQLSARFQPAAVDIKKRMEGLIERDFLERDKTDRKMYRYLA